MCGVRCAVLCGGFRFGKQTDKQKGAKNTIWDLECVLTLVWTCLEVFTQEQPKRRFRMALMSTNQSFIAVLTWILRLLGGLCSRSTSGATTSVGFTVTSSLASEIRKLHSTLTSMSLSSRSLATRRRLVRFVRGSACASPFGTNLVHVTHTESPSTTGSGTCLRNPRTFSRRPPRDTAEKAKVVRLIEIAATSIGLTVTTEDGRNLLGGHSLRVSGTQWMAGMAVPLPLIQLMARWASTWSPGYVSEVPVSNISEIFRRASCARGLEELLREARESTDVARREMERVKSTLRDDFLEEVRAPSVPQAKAHALDTASPLVVKRAGERGGGRMHIVANRALKILPVVEWRTTYGGNSAWPNIPSLWAGPISGRCSGCFKVRDVVGDELSSGQVPH